jgi:hypothetical protein
MSLHRQSIISSNKGVESAPFFLIVSALIMIFTISIFFPPLSDWTTKMEDAAAMRETQKLRDAINEIASMGDLGSIEKIAVNLPSGYYIEVKENELSAYRNSLSEEPLIKLALDAPVNSILNEGSDEQDQVFGHMTIELIYGKPTGNGEAGSFQIFVG